MRTTDLKNAAIEACIKKENLLKIFLTNKEANPKFGKFLPVVTSEDKLLLSKGMRRFVSANNIENYENSTIRECLYFTQMLVVDTIAQIVVYKSFEEQINQGTVIF